MNTLSKTFITLATAGLIASFTASQAFAGDHVDGGKNKSEKGGCGGANGCEGTGEKNSCTGQGDKNKCDHAEDKNKCNHEDKNKCNHKE